MNPERKLVVAGAILLFALAFFFFGQELVNAPDDDAPAGTPTPTSFVRSFEAL